MADFDENTKNSESVNTDDVLADLEALSKKYGLEFDANRYKTSSQNNHYAPHTPDSDSRRTYNPPKNNHPARTPRIVYDGTSASGVKIIYNDLSSGPQGPQGKRVVYQEQETESIVAKRRRNAALAAQQTEIIAQNNAAVQQEETTAVDDDSAIEYRKAVKTHKAQTDSQDVAVSKYSTVSENTEKEEKRIHQHYEVSAKDNFAKFFSSFLPWKGDAAKEVVRKIIMDISAIVVLLCFGVFVNNYIEHQEQLKKQDELNSLQQTEVESENLEEQWAAIKAKYPNIEFPEGMNIKFAELYAANQDLVGWLHIDNTNIDTAVVQNIGDRDSDGEDFYLRHNFYKKYDKYGNVYLDAYNTGSSLDKNNIVCGHNMTDGLAFAQLEKYYTIEGFQESPIIEYSTLYNDYYFKVYGVFITNGYPSGDNGYLFNFITAHFNTDENFESFIEAIDERKLYDTGVDINKDDILITLATCSYEIKKNQMGRLAVVGRLVREGESVEFDTSLAVPNENVRYPQIWYDEHNIPNPYANAYRWEAE